MDKNQKKKNARIIIFAISLCLVVATLCLIMEYILENQGMNSAFAIENEDLTLKENSLKTNLVFFEKVNEAEGVAIEAELPNADGGGKTQDVIDKVSGLLSDEVLPLVAGLVTGLMTILALIVPYVKTIGKLKSTQSAYATVYDEHEKLIGLAKEFDTENVKNDIVGYVVSEVEKRFIRYDKALSEVLGQEEIISAQLTSLVEGAKIAWKQAEGASVVLAKTPTATVVEKQALAIEFLKTMIANELGLKKEELESRMNKELSK